MATAKTAKEKAAAGTLRADRLLTDESSRKSLQDLLAAWLLIANQALDELAGDGRVSVVNAGDQLQKHPAVTVYETASKRAEKIILLLERFDDAGESDPAEELPQGAPARFKPRAV